MLTINIVRPFKIICIKLILEIKTKLSHFYITKHKYRKGIITH